MKNRHSEELRAGIEETKADMDETLDQLSERLRPRHLLDEVVDLFRSRPEKASQMGSEAGQRAGHVARQAGRSVTRQGSRAGRALSHEIREHPIPSLLVAAGLAWWIYDRSTDDEAEEPYAYEDDLEEPFLPPAERGSYAPPSASATVATDPAATEDLEDGDSEGKGSRRERLRARAKAGWSSAAGAASRLGDRAKRKGQSARHRAEGGQEHLRGRAEEWRHRAARKSRRGADRSREQFARVTESNPLAVAAGFLAAGLFLGAVLPATRREESWIGEPARDALGRAKAKGREALHRGRRAVGAAGEAAAETAREKGLTPEGIKGSAQDVAGDASHAGRESAEEHGVTPSAVKEQAKDVSQSAKEAAKESWSKDKGSSKNT